MEGENYINNNYNNTDAKFKNQYIKEVKKLEANNPPSESMVYFSACYSKQLKHVICIGGAKKDNVVVEYPYIYHIETNEWELKDLTTVFNKEIYGHIGCLCDDKILFIFGGYDVKQVFKTDGRETNYSDDIFTISVEDLMYANLEPRKKIGKESPIGRAYHSACYCNDRNCVYVFGGTNMNINDQLYPYGDSKIPEKEKIKRDSFLNLWKFDMDNKKLCWEKVIINNKFKDGCPRGHSMIYQKNKIYIFGGIYGFKKFSNKLFCIDLDKNEMKCLNYEGDNPIPSAFFGMCDYKGIGFMIQGGLNITYKPINQCFIYIYESNKFFKIEDENLPYLFGHQMVSNENGCLIVGGMDNFKYIGNEKLIQNKNYLISGDNEDENKNFVPMKNIISITFEK